MSWTTDVPVLPVDLSLPQERRWDAVLSAMKPEMLKVVSAAGKEMRLVPYTAMLIFGRLYKRHGGLYVKEMKSIAKALNIFSGKAIMLNCAYELSHVSLKHPFGCTAGIRYIEGQGMTHVRTLDWSMPVMGDTTAVFRFHKPGREFLAVGVPGMVGVLSGMVPGKYSVTINWAPPKGWPNFEFGPSFLLRDVLENVDSYDEAVAILRDTPLSTSVFFTVCGVNPGEGCVIERTKRDFVVRQMENGVVVQANHHVADKFQDNNSMVSVMEDAAFLKESWVRADQLTEGLRQYTGEHPVVDLLGDKPVLNPETVQQMVFCPSTGEVKVWRLATE